MLLDGWQMCPLFTLAFNYSICPPSKQGTFNPIGRTTGSQGFAITAENMSRVYTQNLPSLHPAYKNELEPMEAQICIRALVLKDGNI